jgi:hypothetical protein
MKKTWLNKKLFLRAVSLTIGMLLVFAAGCKNPAGSDTSGDGYTPAGSAPVSPVIAGSEAGYEPIDKTLALRDQNQSADPGNLSGVISIWWQAAYGADTYKVYMARAVKFSNTIPNNRTDDGYYYVGEDTIPPGSTAIEPDRPAAPVVSGIEDLFYFARNLEEGGVYYFWLQATNSRGDSQFSGAHSRWMGLKGRQANGGIERADYPKNLQVVPGDQSLAVSWTKSDRAAWYEVYYSTTDIPFSQIDAGGPDNLVPYQSNAISTTATPWNHDQGAAGTVGGIYPIYRFNTTITGLTNGTEYYIWVRSINANGERGLASISAEPAVPLSAPANLTVTAAAAGGQLDLTWNTVTDANKYGIYWSTENKTPKATAYHLEVADTETSYSIRGLNGSTTYYVWVIAFRDLTPGAFGTPQSRTTGALNFESVSTDKKSKNGDIVRNILYIEVNDDDPRIAMGYVLENSGKQFFDYVILFAANLRNRDCEAEVNAGGANHSCTKKGVHLHYNGNVRHILDNRDKYIKPLQDRGIKVLLGLLGDWGGVGFGTLGEWPLTPSAEGASDGYTWPGEYPFGPAVRTAFLTEVKNEVERLGLDGVDFDDEWPSSGIQKGEFMYPSGSLWYNGSSNNLSTLYYGNNALARAEAWKRGGKVMSDVVRETRSLLGPDKIITVFEYHYGQYMPATVTVDGNSVALSTFFNYSTEAVYGSWVPTSSIKTPNAQYAPIGIDICGGDNPNAPRPPITGTRSLYNRMTTFMAATSPYGANMFYGLRSVATAASMSKLVSGGRTWTQAEYLSEASEVVYGEKVIYIGNDYPQDWPKY